MTPYRVFTQHTHYRPTNFIAPRKIDAASPNEAAREVYSKLCATDLETACAMLVVEGHRAYVFSVQRQPSVAAQPMHFGASS